MYSDLIESFINRDIALTYTSQQELYRLSDFMYEHCGKEFDDRQYITFARPKTEEIESWPFVMVGRDGGHLTQSAEYENGRMVMSVQNFLEQYLNSQEELDASSIL